jgi:hypothetical protein
MAKGKRGTHRRVQQHRRGAKAPHLVTKGPPANFGWRYIFWYAWLGTILFGQFLWRNAVTVLSSASAVFAAITVDPNQTIISHEGYHIVLIGQLVLTAVLANIKRDHRPVKKGKK